MKRDGRRITPRKVRISSPLAVLVGSIVVLTYLALGVGFIRANSPTFDEPVHLVAGYSYLASGDFRINPEHPPLIKLLCALPVYVWYRLPFTPPQALWDPARAADLGIWLLSRGTVPADAIVSLARIPNLLLGALLVVVVGWSAYRLWGPVAALVALTAAAFEPSLVAHSALVTTDVGAALFVFLSMYLLYEYVAAPSWARLAGVGLATGLAFAAKYSAVLLLPLMGAVIACHILGGGSASLPPTKPARGSAAKRGLGRRLADALRPAGVIVCLAAAVIFASYFFRQPSAWWKGLLLVRAHESGGHPAYFLGELSQTGWWTYFPVAFLLKTPVGTLVLIIVALAFPRAGQPLRRRELVFFGLPVLLILAVLMWARINIGIRHMLVVHPFLFVLASRAATIRFRRAWIGPTFVGLALVLTATSSLRVAPYQLAYFNELVGGPAEGYRYLGDSNVDWGQGLKNLKAFMDREGLPIVYLSYFGSVPPAAYGIRYQYLPGMGPAMKIRWEVVPDGFPRELVAISVSNLQGLTLPRNPDLYRWLHGRKPVANPGYSILVYDVTADADAHLQLARVYAAAGMPQGTAVELRKVLRLDPANPEAAGLLSTLSPTAPAGAPRRQD